ncbi:MAG: hypothetical protein A2145_05910 [candidate division Zixibacteria bacterium RBG_16_40_9]|nr:MAG: hypothetical protein A2145_05910 [candidate division Zixibacteria bacterium RBG_16_40_9]
MPRTIEQKVKFNLAPEKLFDIYMDAKKHSQACGYKTCINRKVGGNFSIPPYHKGKFLALVPPKLIVQTWRENDWKKTDLDSILILNFSPVRGGGQIHLVHANLPDHIYKAINRGWYKHYWNPWRVYIKKKFKKS